MCRSVIESVYLERVRAGGKEKKSRPHAFANWHSQTGELIKGEKAFSEAPWLSASPYQARVLYLQLPKPQENLALTRDASSNTF